MTKKRLPRCQRGYRRHKKTRVKKTRKCPTSSIYGGTRRSTSPRKSRTKRRGSRKTKKLLIIQSPTPGDDVVISKAIASLVDKRVIVPTIRIPTSKSRAKLIPKIRDEIVQQKSYSPSVNKRLLTMRSGVHANIFGCGIEDILRRSPTNRDAIKEIQVKIGSDGDGKAICASWNSKEAQTVSLDNLKNSKKIDCNRVIAPMQSQSNCWFNTLFITFFISDKGRKFFRYFRQLMIEGKHADGTIIKPSKLAEAFFLFNTAIEASLNLDDNSDETKLASLMDTNNLINAIYASMPVRARRSYPAIKAAGVSNNPLAYYMDIVDYLKTVTGRSSELAIHKIRNPYYFKKLLNKGWPFMVQDRPVTSFPDVIVVTVHDDNSSDKPGNNPGESGKYRDKPLNFVLKGNHGVSGTAKYVLDAAIIRDTEAAHFCSVLTCNGRSMGFDGESFRRMSDFDWKPLINMDKGWTFEGSLWKGTKDSIRWNFCNGYQLLFYYRST